MTRTRRTELSNLFHVSCMPAHSPEWLQLKLINIMRRFFVQMMIAVTYETRRVTKTCSSPTLAGHLCGVSVSNYGSNIEILRDNLANLNNFQIFFLPYFSLKFMSLFDNCVPHFSAKLIFKSY